jgi:hypothetical protein
VVLKECELGLGVRLKWESACFANVKFGVQTPVLKEKNDNFLPGANGSHLNPSYSQSKDQEDHGSKPTPGK